MLTSLVAVIIGGGIGSMFRWIISNKLNGLYPLLPPGTLVANIIAGLVIGFASAIFAKNSDYHNSVKLMITTGLCGGLSTFSTFSEEVFTHLQKNDYLAAGVEVTVHVLLSLLAVYVGFFIASSLPK